MDIQIRAKSSLFGKTGCLLANGVGTIDSDYRDEIKIPLFNTANKSVVIDAGFAIAQIIVAPVVDVPEFARSGNVRLGGFGSTDRDGVEL